MKTEKKYLGLLKKTFPWIALKKYHLQYQHRSHSKIQELIFLFFSSPASLLPIFQPFGCLLGGLLQNHIGRKHGLILTNLLTVAAWILLYEAMSVEMLYGSSILMGISIGFDETPCVTYVSEITTPKLRGTLVSYNNSNVVFGITLTFMLASFMSWRSSCLVCVGLSVFSVLLLALVSTRI